MDALGWEQILSLPAAIVVLILILLAVLKAMPHWKEIKLAEISVREKEAESRVNESSVFAKMSDALNSISTVLQTITVEQRRDSERLHLLQRVNADTNDKILARLDSLDNLSHQIDDNRRRLDDIEVKLQDDDSV